jgi:hypothetical protein
LRRAVAVVMVVAGAYLLGTATIAAVNVAQGADVALGVAWPAVALLAFAGAGLVYGAAQLWRGTRRSR